jgi:predicted dehydrogenase
MKPMGTVVVGCGNVASFYCGAMSKHPILKFLGVMDSQDARASAYSAYYSVPKFKSLEAVLDDPRVELVLNLTNPASHYQVSRACLEAGKHVYSEKPLAMEMAQAKELVDLAQRKGLYLASAPSRVLAETGQTMWKALRENVIGNVYAVYAEMDGTLIHREAYKEWVNEVGMHWPYWDELEVGCTIEHAGYPVSWLTAYFGPVETITTFATCQVTDIGIDLKRETIPPDLTVACLKFKSGLVARLTSSWIAPHDHSIRIFGDTGVLTTDDIWAAGSRVYITRNRAIRIGSKSIRMPRNETYPMASPPKGRSGTSTSRGIPSPRAIVRGIRARFLHLRKRPDFCLGPAELASAFREQRACRLSPEYCLHNTEVVLAIHNALTDGPQYTMTTAFPPMEPLPWASANVGG